MFFARDPETMDRIGREIGDPKQEEKIDHRRGEMAGGKRPVGKTYRPATKGFRSKAHGLETACR